METGDLIYIIALGVMVVSSLIGGLTKKKGEQHKQQQTPEPEIQEVEPPRKYESLEDFFGSWEKPKEKPKVTKPKAQTVTAKPRTMLADEYDRIMAEGRSAFETSYQSVTQDESPNPILEDFEKNPIKEIRKAIIYSEIINRKY